MIILRSEELYINQTIFFFIIAAISSNFTIEKSFVIYLKYSLMHSHYSRAYFYKTFDCVILAIIILITIYIEFENGSRSKEHFNHSC